MSEVQRRQREFCQPLIEDIVLKSNSRDDMHVVLRGFQDQLARMGIGSIRPGTRRPGPCDPEGTSRQFQVSHLDS